MINNLDKATRDELVRVANRLADAARPETLRHFRQASLVADNKAGGVDFDPVTQADRAAEQAMRDILAVERPNDAILGEEFGKTAGTSGLTWTLDPIDGTRGYISGTPTWGVLISVSDDNGPLFGLIDQPYIGERFSGGFGVSQVDGPHGSQRLATRNGTSLERATLLTTFPEVGAEIERAAFRQVANEVRLVRYGMDCYGYALLATGQVDLVIEAGLQPYDITAPIAVIEAAGGIVTNWNGGRATQGGQVIAAGNAEVHAAALAILRNAIDE